MRRWTAVAALLLVASPGPAAAPTGEGPACSLPDADRRWVQRALDGFDRVNDEFLELGAAPLPWTVLYDAACAWHLAPGAPGLQEAAPAGLGLTYGGEPVPVRVEEHGGAVRLPRGDRIPADRDASFASVYETEAGEPAPFFVLALPEVWVKSRDVERDRELEVLLLGIAAHEMVHTRQLPDVSRRVEELREEYDLPEDLGDDIVEERFGDEPAFREAYERETDLFYRAVAEDDGARARALARRALDSVRAREAEFFTGDEAFYRELDALFLNMEGVAVWAAYRLSKTDPVFDIGMDDPAEDRAKNSWSQDRGLALFLLIDRWLSGWQDRALGPEVASPYDLLKEAVTDGPIE